VQDLKVIQHTEKAWSKFTIEVYDWVDLLQINLPNFILTVFVLILFIILDKYFNRLADKLFRKSNVQESVRTVL